MKIDTTLEGISPRARAINEVYEKTYSKPLPVYLKIFGTKSMKRSWYNRRFMKLMTEKGISPFLQTNEST